MTKKVINTKQAPAPVGPYSQAIKAGNFLFLSGQVAFDPATGQLVEGDIKAHTRQVMENLKAVLTAAGSSFAGVVKSVIFLTDMGDFPVVNEIYGSYFGEEPPARSCIQVAGLPKNAPIEIEMIAIID